jgi:4-hydroxybenzoate polyprenyltransferase
MHTRIRAWAQLVRVPNTLTACADVLAGFSIAVGPWFAIDGIAVSLLLMCSASVCLYWAGMVLNDVHDIEADRIQRRKGPLVDGRIDIQTAAIAGWMLLFTGILLSGVSSYLLPDPSNTSTRNPSKWLVVGIGSLLAMVIAAYDSRLKATIFGPLLMGMCRTQFASWNFTRLVPCLAERLGLDRHRGCGIWARRIRDGNYACRPQRIAPRPVVNAIGHRMGDQRSRNCGYFSMSSVG